MILRSFYVLLALCLSLFVSSTHPFESVFATVDNITARGSLSGNFNSGRQVTAQEITFTIHSTNPSQIYCRLTGPGDFATITDSSCGSGQSAAKLYPASTFTINGQYTFEATDGVFAHNSSDFQFTIVGASGQGAEITAGVTNEENLGAPSQATILAAPNNAPWKSCAVAQNIKTKNEKYEDVTREQKLNLVAMIYNLKGTIPLNILQQQTQADNISKVLLQVDSDFINYTNKGNMRSLERESSNAKIPLKVKEFSTRCMYQAPTSAVVSDIVGPNVKGQDLAFELSNPPFLHCGEGSQGAIYTLNFAVSPADYIKFSNTKFVSNQPINFELSQIIGGSNSINSTGTKYAGKLITDEGQVNEKSFDLIVDRGTSIFTECYIKVVQ